MNLHQLTMRPCPVCQSTDTNHTYFKSNIDTSQLGKLSYASRKMPELMNFTLVRCPDCDLLYAPHVPSSEFLTKAYETTDYDSNEEAHYAAKSYARWLTVLANDLPDRSAALEIGAGNGAFLEELLHFGFQEVIGIEPSQVAINSASENIKAHIKPAMFTPQDFPSNHYALITIFQTLEHIDDPAKFFSDALQLLKPGGILMIVAHNYQHWLMRLLGKKSPIVDIEHLQIFSPRSLQFSLKKLGFQHMRLHSLRNTYPLHYWTKLLPLPKQFKNCFYHFLKNGNGKKIGKLPLSFKVGNMIAWAKK